MVPIMMTTPTEWIGSAEACQILDVDRSTLVRMVKSGRLTAETKMPGASGAYVFARSDVEALAAQRNAE